MIVSRIKFPEYTGARCLMMPYIQGDPSSVPEEYAKYSEIVSSLFFKRGDIGYLTIDESEVKSGNPHRGAGSRTSRALHTEAGRRPGDIYAWGWGKTHNVKLERSVKVMLANSVDNTCAIWDAIHEDTSRDGDIGYAANLYPYEDAIMMKAGEVYKIGILTPHESLPVNQDIKRQFLRIVSSGVHGREPYFTDNPLLS